MMLESLLLLRSSSVGASLELIPSACYWSQFTVLLEKCGPWSGLTEFPLLGPPVVAAQHICHKTSDVSSVFYYSRFSLTIALYNFKA